MANEWRAVIAALANPEMRTVVALLTLGQDAEAYLAERAPSRRRHLVQGLRAAGLVADEDGRLVLREAVFGDLLRQDAVVRPTGVDRFLRDGRIVQYPSSAVDRAALLTHVAERVLDPGEVVDERTINERLAAFVDDVAVLRRSLVDHGLVERRADGSEYARA